MRDADLFPLGSALRFIIICGNIYTSRPYIDTLLPYALQGKSSRTRLDVWGFRWKRTARIDAVKFYIIAGN